MRGLSWFVKRVAGGPVSKQRPCGRRILLEGLEPRCLLSVGYVQTNIISDQQGVAAHTDPNLVNPWGVSFAPQQPLWIADNAKGVSTVDDASGMPDPANPPLVVNIPGPTGGLAGPTGTVFNGSNNFVVSNSIYSQPAQFLFATVRGTIAGWYPILGSNAVTVVNNSAAGAVYTGLALDTTASGDQLYAADFSKGTIDVFNGSFQPVTPTGTFSDPALPAGYAPYNVQNLGGNLYVEYALKDPVTHRPTAALGDGYVDEYDPNGTLIRRVASQGTLNAPWGVALAPASFGQFGGDLLVGNFGDGKVSAYNPSNGAFQGQLTDTNGQTLSIDGLWTLMFGDGGVSGDPNTLYFTAGPNQETHGLFGSLIPNPAAPNTPQLAAQDDTGINHGDGITQNNGTVSAPLTYTVTGVSPANGFASLYNDTNPSSPTLLAGPVQAVNGTATFTIAGAQPLADGTYQIAATMSATSGGAQSALSGAASLTIETSLLIAGVSPSTNFVTSLPNGQVVVTFDHNLGGLTPDVASGSAFTSNPFAVMLVPSGPDGGALFAAHSASLWTAPSGVDGGDLPVPATLVYHQNANGTSQITLTPALPLSTDIYVVSVNGLTDPAGNPLTGSGGPGTPFFMSFDLHASAATSSALAVTGVTANHGAVVINNNSIPQPDTIGITFNKALSTWTVNTNTIHLYAQTGPAMTAPVQAAVAYSPTTRTAYLTPEATLMPGTVYFVAVDPTVSDDQSFPASGGTLGSEFATSFTVSGPAASGASPLTVLRTSPANGTQFFQPLGYGSVTFSEGINMQSLGRFSAMLVSQTGGVTTGTSGYADVPLNAKLAFNPNTNQIIIVPTQPLANHTYLFALSRIQATNGDALTNPGGSVPVFSTFQLASNALPAHLSPSGGPGIPALAGTIVAIPSDTTTLDTNARDSDGPSQNVVAPSPPRPVKPRLAPAQQISKKNGAI